MQVFRQRLRVLAARRVVVAAAFAALALSVGAGVVLAGAAPRGVSVQVTGPVPRALEASGNGGRVIVGHALRSDRSAPLRSLRAAAASPAFELETSPNPRPVSLHVDHVDTARQNQAFAPNMPSPSLSFDGIPSGAVCSCAPPDTNGEVGLTQYVQSVNAGFQVFDKTTGASVFGPVTIATLWSGLGGVCETNGDGDPVVLYDQLADRWLISQFAGVSVPTDECIAVSTTGDATGSYARYDFHLGSDFFDYPHFGVWPDAYYMSMNVFNSAGTAFLGAQPFAFDRAALLAGDPNATFVTTRDPSVFNPGTDAMLPADLDGSLAPPPGAPEPFLTSGTLATDTLWRFHADFVNPASSTFANAGTLTPAPFTALCPSTSACVPEPNGQKLDGIGDRGMFRLAYRNFGGHEALVGNQSVSSGGVAGIRWYEIANATSGTPSFAQQSTYQPDTTWRWLGSAAMDGVGDLALGFSASSGTVVPALRYAGRLASDPPNTLAQGEATLYAGVGSQTGTNNRWGDYSDLTVDPVDDCTFWYTNEYYPSGSTSFNWRTRIGSFRFPSCHTVKGVAVSKAGNGTGTVSSAPGGIACGASCGALFDGGGSVTLTATPDASSNFTGWSGGGCTGTGTCTLTMDAGKTVTATFALKSLTVGVTKAGAGTGSVTSSPAGITCPGTCLASYLYGTSVTLTAAASGTSRFAGWSGACSGTGPCVLSLTANQAVTATFNPPPLRCTVPRVVGLRLAKARTRIVRAHCRVGKVARKHVSRARRGKVVSQTPKSGRKLKNGARVNLVVGK